VSSAILYVAIVAIWACVLIPRWLRRDSARGASSASDGALPGDGDAVSDEPGSRDGDPGVSGVSGVSGAAGRADAGAGRVQARAEAAEHPEDAAEPPRDAPPPLPPLPPLTPEEARQRVLTARRRLLGMLLALEIAAITLAVFGLAALWVVIPPSVMMGGYLLLLREAAHADAEQAARKEEAARASARARQARARARARVAATGTAPVTVAAPAPAPAPAYEDTGPGRDFAPGLAGKYTTSNADAAENSEPAGDGYYEQYTENRLRAVGD
jgi:hypothetical protein